jgi:hypothetical protein
MLPDELKARPDVAKDGSGEFGGREGVLVTYV